MINPFKKSYKIVEITIGNKKHYIISHGNCFSREFISEYGTSISADYALKLESLEDVKQKIKDCLEKELEERLNKPTTKTIQYV